MKRRFTISRMTSRGVKCSPAVSFDCSENRRISSSKIDPMTWFGTASGWRSTSANFESTWKSRFDSSSLAICSANLKRSMTSRAFGEKPLMYAVRFWAM